MKTSAKSPNLILFYVSLLFTAVYFIPFDHIRVSGALQEAFLMLGEYAREHVLLCLIPAFFIAGAIGVFLNQQSVIKYLGPRAPKPLAYAVASVSGAILAVCSCTVLPLFKGIYKKGAGLGPAVSFLYSGPAISVLAITLSFQVFGWELGLARTVGSLVFSLVIGLVAQFIFRKDDEKRLTDERLFKAPVEESGRSLAKTGIFVGTLVGILIFLNWADPRGGSGFWDAVFQYKWWISGTLGLVLLLSLLKWFKKGEVKEWAVASRDFGLQIIPLLFLGVLVSGFLLGRPGHDGLIPSQWIAGLVGGNSLGANLIASVSGAFMYFATLTEVPIVQGLLGSGMGQGPALALLLSGPSLSLPAMLVIHGELGFRKTAVYVILVVGLSTLAGLLFGAYAA